ncbi:MAG: ZPR1 zinc finger domain-containing protein [Candidatus Syntrophoarchaeum sp. WYZ-LMO15]|nr:MAG: ZPR1 zinc finger domain-containing protein [Candidatus Syntrophoarchaeum sp. WYZ-LMO15]
MSRSTAENLSENIDPGESPLSLRQPCPICGNEMEVTFTPITIPYFGDAISVRSTCECGYRHSDVMIVSDSKASKFELEISSCEDLSIRVIRSTTGRIEIPELGIEIKPGPAAESFISNVEGVLSRIQEVLRMTRDWAVKEGDDERLAEIDRVSGMIEEVKKGKLPVTLIIEDRLGNSAILSEKAKKWEMEEDL